jgi:methionine-rich copper-binding protein CopC
MLVGANSVRAHDDIASSTPPSLSTIDSPISTVEIDFGEPINDQVSMFLTYDEGDANIVDLGGTTVKTGDTTARLDFDQIERRGTYFVQYLAPITTDGHVMAGAITFTYGEPSGSGTGFPWIPFLAVSVVVLAIGAWFSYRRMLVRDDEQDDHHEPTPLPDVSDLV